MDACTSDASRVRFKIAQRHKRPTPESTVAACVLLCAEQAEAPSHSLVTLADHSQCLVPVVHGRYPAPGLLPSGRDLHQDPLRAQRDQRVAIGQAAAAADVCAIEAALASDPRAVGPLDQLPAEHFAQLQLVLTKPGLGLWKGNLLDGRPMPVRRPAVVEDDDCALLGELRTVGVEQHLLHPAPSAEDLWIAEAEEDVAALATLAARVPLRLLCRRPMVDDDNLRHAVEALEDLVPLSVVRYAIGVDPIPLPCLPLAEVIHSQSG